MTEELRKIIKDLCNFRSEEPDSFEWCMKRIKALREEIGKQPKLFCYSKPNVMDGYLQNGDCHSYTDDVALCYATDLDNAIEIFSKMYSKELLDGNVREVKFNIDRVFIATDY